MRSLWQYAVKQFGNSDTYRTFKKKCNSSGTCEIRLDFSNERAKIVKKLNNFNSYRLTFYQCVHIFYLPSKITIWFVRTMLLILLQILLIRFTILIVQYIHIYLNRHHRLNNIILILTQRCASSFGFKTSVISRYCLYFRFSFQIANLMLKNFH